LEELTVLSDALQRFVDSGGNRGVLGDLGELRGALERVTEYQNFQPDRFDRREANRRLQASRRDRRVQP